MLYTHELWEQEQQSFPCANHNSAVLGRDIIEMNARDVFSYNGYAEELFSPVRHVFCLHTQYSFHSSRVRPEADVRCAVLFDSPAAKHSRVKGTENGLNAVRRVYTTRLSIFFYALSLYTWRRGFVQLYLRESAVYIASVYI